MVDGSPSGDNGGWSEYRRLVLDLLERHDTALSVLSDRMESVDKDCANEIERCRKEIRDHVDQKFVMLGQMHQKQVENAKIELEVAIQRAAENEKEITITRVTKKWDFWMQVIISLTALGTAVIALIK